MRHLVDFIMNLAALIRSARPRAIRALAALGLLAFGAAAPARAQTFGVDFLAGCGPGGALGCSTARFTIDAPVVGLTLNWLTLTLNGGAYLFAPSTPIGATIGSFVAQDDFSPFGGFTTISLGGTRLFVDFVDTGDPLNPGFPFTLGPASSGYFEVDVLPVNPAAPASAIEFDYLGQLDGGGSISGSVTATPEPGTVLLLATGLIGLAGGSAARRRRSRS